MYKNVSNAIIYKVENISNLIASNRRTAEPISTQLLLSYPIVL